MALFTAAAILVGLGCSTVGSGSGTGGADAPPHGTGGVIVPHDGTGGVIASHDGTGGVIVPHDGGGGVIVPNGTGGEIVSHDGTGGAIARSTCPVTPPADGSPCDGNDPWCFYQDCAGAGRTLAECQGGAWSVTNTPTCDGTTCLNFLDTKCAGSAICHITQSGSLYATCDSTTGPIGPIGPCGHPNDICRAPGSIGCSWNATLSAGITETCVTCLSGPSCI